MLLSPIASSLAPQLARVPRLSSWRTGIKGGEHVPQRGRTTHSPRNANTAFPSGSQYIVLLVDLHLADAMVCANQVAYDAELGR